MESERLVRAFLDEGLPVLALKGLALRGALYRPRGWVRGPGDLDLLLPRDRLSRAASLLGELGWVPAGKYPADLYREHHHIEPHVHPRLPSVVVDVHWSPVKAPHPFALDLEAWWGRAVPQEGGPEGLRRLDDLDCLVHLCLQLDHDDSYAGKVRSLFDLAAFARDRRVDGRSLAARAREVGGSREVARAFGTAGRLLGALPPAGLPLSRGPGGPAGILWRRMVERALFRRLRPSRLPAWYVRHAVEVLGREQGTMRAAWALLRPIWSNPRLGGRGFHPEDGLTGRR
jgi:hypothetical protein